MAEGIARRLDTGRRLLVQSAGSHPSIVHPVAIQVLEEAGIDVSNQRSKSVREIDPATVDIVITLCAEEECPLFLGDAERLHWPLPDPVGSDRESTLLRFREIRDDLDRRLRVWMNERGLLGGER
jgi:arsenate reductase